MVLPAPRPGLDPVEPPRPKMEEIPRSRNVQILTGRMDQEEPWSGAGARALYGSLNGSGLPEKSLIGLVSASSSSSLRLLSFRRTTEGEAKRQTLGK